MAIDERTWRHLHERLDAAIGQQAADALLEEVTVLEREQLSTRHDVELLRGDVTELRGEFTELRGDFAALRGEFDGLRGEFEGLRGEFNGLRGEFTEHRTEVRSEIGGVRTELEVGMANLRAEIYQHTSAQTRLLMFGMIGSMLTVAVMAFGAAQLA